MNVRRDYYCFGICGVRVIDGEMQGRLCPMSLARFRRNTVLAGFHDNNPISPYCRLPLPREIARLSSDWCLDQGLHRLWQAVEMTNQGFLVLRGRCGVANVNMQGFSGPG